MRRRRSPPLSKRIRRATDKRGLEALEEADEDLHRAMTIFREELGIAELSDEFRERVECSQDQFDRGKFTSLDEV